MPREFYDRHEDGYVLATMGQGSGMSDDVDRAQEREQIDRDLRLREIAESRKPGLTHCEDCAVPITAARQALGARKCLEHQSALEQDARRRTARTAV